MTFSYVLNILLVAFAFGFVIFWHELGHFLAARWAGVRVEQFAVGMGQAIFSYRKGIGIRGGNTQAEWDRRVDAEIAKRKTELPPADQDREWSLRERYDVARDLGLGETDYRFNWIPLGGYVKPTGQDDLRPAKEVASDDPHAFGAKPVSKRMVIICAGVVMNVILAFALYVALFLHGFNAPPTVVGQVLPGSPAQAAGLKAGDTILAVNGHPQHDYAKLRMNIALLRTDEPAAFEVDRAGRTQTLQITPAKNKLEYGLPAVGVASAATLEAAVDDDTQTKLISPELGALPAKSRIVKVGDVDVSKDDSDRALTAAIESAGGRPVAVTVRNADNSEHAFEVRPTLMRRFNDAADDTRGFIGLQPRVRITGLQKGAPADKAGVKPGDVIEQISVVGTGEARRPPSFGQFMKWTAEAASQNKKIRLTLIRDGKSIDPIEIDPTFTVERGRRGIGVAVDLDLGDAVIADVTADSVAGRAGVKAGERVTAINGKPAPTWPDVLAALRSAGETADIELASEGGSRKVHASLSTDDHTTLATTAFTHALPLAQLMKMRSTTNPLEAAAWGYEETKASIFQVYVTIRRLFEGSVPLSNLSGPVGIFTAGTTAASRGIDWLIWFTALISANLAVVNFLPIPIVDGGLFAFLVAEKVTGRPPSPRVQTAAQIIGIVLLGSLFLFVTYNDILRQWG